MEKSLIEKILEKRELSFDSDFKKFFNECYYYLLLDSYRLNK